MSLAALLYPPPTPNGWQEWVYQNLTHHEAIISAARQSRNAGLILYQIYPFNSEDPEGWLLQHQSQHNDMNGLFGVNGSDLSTLDFSNKRDVDAWLQLHFYEHQDVAARCGVPI
jgi:hypothetical protein